MKINKIVGLGLAMVLSLGCLVGCNKTEEEKIMEDIEQIEYLKKWRKEHQ